MARLTPQDLADWKARVARWRSSGLSASDYAQHHGLDSHELRWWTWYVDGRKGKEPVREEPERGRSVEEVAQESLEDILSRAPGVDDVDPEAVALVATKPRLTAEALEEAHAIAEELRRRRLKDSPWQFIKERPTPKQKEFLSLDCEEALFGGATGGGKSSCLLMAALEWVHIPTYSAIVFRRTYADLALPGAIMDRAYTWLNGTGATWNAQKKEWTFPSGAKLTFGYMDTDKDRYRYQGAEFSCVIFDELTQFPEKWYTYMFSRLRKKATDPFPLRMRSATNPGGVGHAWVKRRFIDGITDGSSKPVFVPSLLKDNPHVDQASYLRSLERLDATTRKQLLEGAWVQDANTLVYRYDDDVMGVDSSKDEPVECDFHVLGLDFGFTDDTAFVVLGWNRNDPTVYVLESEKHPGLTPSTAAERVLAFMERYTFDAIVGDTGGLGKGYAEEMKSRFAIPIESAKKTEKAAYIRFLLGDMEKGRVKFVRGMNDELVQEMSELPWKEDRSGPEDGFPDHLCDALLYGWRAATAFAESPPDEAPRPEPGTKEYWDAEEERMLKALEGRLGAGEEDKPYWDRFEQVDPEAAWSGS